MDLLPLIWGPPISLRSQAACKDASWLMVLEIWREMLPMQAPVHVFGFCKWHASCSQWSFIVFVHREHEDEAGDGDWATIFAEFCSRTWWFWAKKWSQSRFVQSWCSGCCKKSTSTSDTSDRNRCLTISHFDISWIWKATFEEQSAGQRWSFWRVPMFSRLQSGGNVSRNFLQACEPWCKTQGSARCHQLSLCNSRSLTLSSHHAGRQILRCGMNDHVIPCIHYIYCPQQCLPRI